MSRIVHLHVDPSLTEEIHIVLHRGDAAGLFFASDLVDVPEDEVDDAYDEGDSTEDASDAALESIYGRFKAYDPATPAREVVERLHSEGWVAHPPRHRVGSVNRSAYVRLTFTGSKRRVSAYLQTNGIVVDRAADFERLKSLPGAQATTGSKQRVSFLWYDESGDIRLDDVLAALADLRKAADGG